jgi:hypothetical protein
VKVNPCSRLTLAALLSFALVACSDTETEVVTVPVDRVVETVPACSTTFPGGACAAGQTCFQGACVEAASLCSVTNQTGTCQAGFSCYFGGCIPTEVVPPPPVDPTDPCEQMVNTAQPALSFAGGQPVGAGGAAYTYDHDGDAGTPAVAVPYVQKAAIVVDGLHFRDLNASLTL